MSESEDENELDNETGQLKTEEEVVKTSRMKFFLVLGYPFFFIFCLFSSFLQCYHSPWSS